jgi:hypothetical protein
MKKIVIAGLLKGNSVYLPLQFAALLQVLFNEIQGRELCWYSFTIVENILWQRLAEYFKWANSVQSTEILNNSFSDFHAGRLLLGLFHTFTDAFEEAAIITVDVWEILGHWVLYQ